MNATFVRVATPVVVGTGLAVVLGAGIAAAYYTTAVAPTGAGTANVTAPMTIPFAATASPAVPLYPGGPGGAITFDVTNPYSVAVTFTAISVGNASGCTTPDVTASSPLGTLPLPVPGGATVEITMNVTMGLAASNDCQGATLTVPVTLTGRL